MFFKVIGIGILICVLLFFICVFVVGLYDGWRGVNRFADNNYENENSYLKETESMSGIEFEYYCANILKRNNFLGIEMTKTSGDQGVDILAVKNGKKYACQCKKYASSVGNRAVQEIIAGKNFYSCDIGVVITNSYFTKSAIELADKTGIILLNGSDLQRFEDGMLL